jgi:hypothetical protein
VWYGPSRPTWHSKSNHYAWQLIVANRVPHSLLRGREEGSSRTAARVRCCTQGRGWWQASGPTQRLNVSQASEEISGNPPLSLPQRFTVELSGQARECGVMSDGIPCASGLRGQDPGARKSGSWALMRSGSTALSPLTTKGEAALNRQQDRPQAWRQRGSPATFTPVRSKSVPAGSAISGCPLPEKKRRFWG